MRLLLDSNVVVWWHQAELSERTQSWIESGEAQVYVSVVTPWELGIKQAKGKFEISKSIAEIVRESAFETLPIRWDHVEAANRLSGHHGDPFDRMLVAQAQCEGLSLVTDDVDLAEYQVHVVPARD
jgi:PIN domain nuclease of toxin-antitoxin system